MKVPCSGSAWSGSRTTATVTELGLADAAAGRIEIDPAGSRQIDLRPGMGGAMSPVNGADARRFLIRLERHGEVA